MSGWMSRVQFDDTPVVVLRLILRLFVAVLHLVYDNGFVRLLWEDYLVIILS